MSIKAPSISIRWLVLGVVGLLAVILANEIARRQNYMVDGDFFEHWLAGRLVWTSKNIYDTQVWTPEHVRYGNTVDRNPVFPSPPATAFVMAPVGLLPLNVASVSWVVLSAGLILLSTRYVLSLSDIHTRMPYLLPILAGVFLFRPVMVTLRNGQFGAVLLFCSAMVVWFWARDRWFAGGLALGLFFLRPNLGLAIIGLVCIWLLLRKRWSALGGVMVSLAGLAALSWAKYPNWLAGMLAMGDTKLSNTFGYHPNLWGLAGVICRHELTCTLTSGSLFVLLLSGISVLAYARLSSREDPKVALGFILPLALMFTPYMWAYDQILLVVPILIITINLYRRGVPYLLTATFPLLMACLALALLAVDLRLGTDAPGVILSLACFALMFLRVSPEQQKQPDLYARSPQ